MSNGLLFQLFTLFKGMREYRYSKRELLNVLLYLVVDNGLASFATRKRVKQFEVFIVVLAIIDSQSVFPMVEKTKDINDIS